MTNWIGVMLGLLCGSAWATEGAAPPAPSVSGQLVMLGGFLLVFYFLIWRPQSKRAKTHQQLIAGLAKGDEVITTGGLMGRVVQISEQFLTLAIAEEVEVKVQKQAITACLPKGTIKSLN